MDLFDRIKNAKDIRTEVKSIRDLMEKLTNSIDSIDDALGDKAKLFLEYLFKSQFPYRLISAISSYVANRARPTESSDLQKLEEIPKIVENLMIKNEVDNLQTPLRDDQKKPVFDDYYNPELLTLFFEYSVQDPKYSFISLNQLESNIREFAGKINSLEKYLNKRAKTNEKKMEFFKRYIDYISTKKMMSQNWPEVIDRFRSAYKSEIAKAPEERDGNKIKELIRCVKECHLIERFERYEKIETTFLTKDRELLQKALGLYID